MRRTKIEWCNFVINPVKGICPMHCKDKFGKEYCYSARPNGLYKRFKWNPEIRYDNSVWHGKTLPKGSKIFIGSTMELFGDWIKESWLSTIFKVVKNCPDYTFIFLTKKPENLIRYSPYPENVWIGASVTDQPSYERALRGLSHVGAMIRFMSFEPLLKPINILGADFALIQWAIIGQCTPVHVKTAPLFSWIREIVESADKAGIPVFEKNNLASLLKRPLRQEYPQ